jgi:hypothetical protein
MRAGEEEGGGEICTIIYASVSVPSGLRIELFTLEHIKELCPSNLF